MPNISDYQRAQHESFKRDVSIQAGGPGSGGNSSGPHVGGTDRQSPSLSSGAARARARAKKEALARKNRPMGKFPKGYK